MPYNHSKKILALQSDGETYQLGCGDNGKLYCTSLQKRMRSVCDTWTGFLGIETDTNSLVVFNFRYDEYPEHFYLCGTQPLESKNDNTNNKNMSIISDKKDLNIVKYETIHTTRHYCLGITKKGHIEMFRIYDNVESKYTFILCQPNERLKNFNQNPKKIKRVRSGHLTDFFAVLDDDGKVFVVGKNEQTQLNITLSTLVFNDVIFLEEQLFGLLTSTEQIVSFELE